jgi:hypothetical protein
MGRDSAKGWGEAVSVFVRQVVTLCVGEACCVIVTMVAWTRGCRTTQWVWFV